ncbi:MAG TPA: flagellar hook-length control protein FliK [Phycisphaerae bacterium]|nr:flagellar hook-length control protein FliK [Phycisphaerae bacterium]
MQVSPLPVLMAAGSAGQSTGLVLSLLNGLSGFGSHSSVAGCFTFSSVGDGGPEQQLDQQRRDAEERRAGLAAAATPEPAEVTFQAERRMDPSSRAWRRQQLNAHAPEQKTSHGGRVFRQALADAGSPRGGEARKPAAATTNDATRPDPVTQGDGRKGRSTKAAPPAEGESGKSSPSSSTGRLGAARSGESSPPTVRPIVAEGRPPAGARAGRSATAVRPVIASAGVGDRSGVEKALASHSGKPAGNARPAAAISPAHGDARTPLKSTSVATKSAANAQRAETADRQENVERVLRTIHSRLGRQRSTAILLLDPPELGRVRLHMDLRNDALSLRMDTQTQVAHRLLMRELDSLRQGLESAGIHLERVEVRPPSPPPEGAGADLGQQADANDSEHDQSAETGTEHPDHKGTEARSHEGTEAAAEASMSPGQGAAGGHGVPAAESLVNVLA